MHYDYELDPEGGTSGAILVRVTGRDKRVLDVGCAAGTLDRILVDRGCQVVGVEGDPDAAMLAEKVCERVVVGDLDLIDLAAELAGDTFDVILAGDVLEHLRDPVRTLRQLRGLLRPGGYLAISIPNVAHGSVRLALLHGGFPRADLGLLDRTHLQFVTRDSLADMVADGGWTPALIEPIIREPLDSEVPFPLDALTEKVVGQVVADPEAWAYQYLVIAYPTAPEGLTGLPAVLSRLGADVRRLTAELAELRRVAAVDERREQLTLELLEARDERFRAERAAEILEATGVRRDAAFRAALADRDEREAGLRAELAVARSAVRPAGQANPAEGPAAGLAPRLRRAARELAGRLRGRSA